MNRKKLIYSILKELDKGNKPKQSDYGLDLEEWGQLGLLIKNEGFANGIAISWGDNTFAEVSFSSAEITIKGLDYLEQNSAFAKTYKSLKEARDWFKL